MAFNELTEEAALSDDQADALSKRAAQNCIHTDEKRDALDEQEQKSAKAALTELFLETKTDQTPAVVERIVNDIDQIVTVVRYDGWQDSAPGRKEVQRVLRKALLKYKLHKDQELFDRAYGYIEQYY